MSASWTTIELARLHETQGYFSEARDLYLNLLALDQDNQDAALGVQRTAVMMDGKMNAQNSMEKIRHLAGQWSELLAVLVHVKSLHTMESSVS
ncbi:MAG: hypothetical protein V1793_00385 [Pseudomonadota bacterium]